MLSKGLKNIGKRDKNMFFQKKRFFFLRKSKGFFFNSETDGGLLSAIFFQLEKLNL